MRERDSEAALRGRAFLLLPSKTTCPGLEPGAVKRHAVAEKLAQIPQYGVTTVVAPAGFGKTSAVAAWAHTTDQTVAWCALDEDDGDPARFWFAVISALEAAGIPAIDAFNPTEIGWTNALEGREALAELLLGFSASQNPFVLILEDFYQIQDAPIVTEGLAYLVRNLPSPVRLVLTSRTPITLPLAKIRARGDLLEITERDLRLSPEEQAELFAASCPNLSPEELQQIEDATQGWPAGCRLIELKCRALGGDVRIADILRDARENVGDYLFEEVVEGLADDLGKFLTDTAVVDSFNASLAASITNQSLSDVRDLLDRLVEGGVFIQRMEGEDSKVWYRYHQMLLDLLRTRGRREDEDRQKKCALRARDWFFEEGFDDTAVSLCFSIRDFEGVCDIIEQRWKSLYMNDELEVLLRWSALIPDTILETKPFLCAVTTLPHLSAGDYLRAHNLVQKALLQLGDDDEFLFAFCLVQQAFIASFEGRLQESGTIAQKALEYLPEEEQYLRGMMMQVASSARWAENPIAAIEGYAEALPLQRKVGNINLLCSALCNLAVFEATVGHLGNAERNANEALELYDPEEREGKPMVTFAHRALAECAYERGNAEAFEAECEAFNLVAAHGVVRARSAEMSMLKAKHLLALSHLDTAAAEFFAAIATDEEAALSMMPPLPLVRAWCGRFRNAAAERMKRTEVSQRIALFNAMVGLCLGDPSAPDTLDTLAQKASEADSALHLRALVIAAIAAEAVGKMQRALMLIRNAYHFAVDRGLMVAFLENAEAMRPFVQLLRSSDNKTDEAIAKTIEDANTPMIGAADALTARELDVLRLMADGATVAQAADTLVVSRETVKKHLGNIYTKLGVHSKMQAVALLRDEGVL